MAGQHALVLSVDSVEFGRDVKLAPVGDDFRTAADGIDGDLVTAGDTKHGLEFRFEEAPVTGFRAGWEVVMRHDGPFVV